MPTLQNYQIRSGEHRQRDILAAVVSAVNRSRSHHRCRMPREQMCHDCREACNAAGMSPQQIREDAQ